jgi:hypothetical protein
MKSLQKDPAQQSHWWTSDKRGVENISGATRARRGDSARQRRHLDKTHAHIVIGGDRAGGTDGAELGQLEECDESAIRLPFSPWSNS